VSLVGSNPTIRLPHHPSAALRLEIPPPPAIGLQTWLRTHTPRAAAPGRLRRESPQTKRTTPPVGSPHDHPRLLAWGVLRCADDETAPDHLKKAAEG